MGNKANMIDRREISRIPDAPFWLSYWTVSTHKARLTTVKASVPADQLLVFNVKEGWAPLCQFLGKKSPVAAQMIKRSINQMNDALSGAIMHMDADQNLLLTKHSDQKTAVEAQLKSESALFRGD